jgi:hypothetical protein
MDFWWILIHGSLLLELEVLWIIGPEHRIPMQSIYFDVCLLLSSIKFLCFLPVHHLKTHLIKSVVLESSRNSPHMAFQSCISCSYISKFVRSKEALNFRSVLSSRKQTQHIVKLPTDGIRGWPPPQCGCDNMQHANHGILSPDHWRSWIHLQDHHHIWACHQE